MRLSFPPAIFQWKEARGLVERITAEKGRWKIVNRLVEPPLDTSFLLDDSSASECGSGSAGKWRSWYICILFRGLQDRRR